MTYTQALQRVREAGRAYNLACDAREKNRSVETATAKAAAYQRFEEAQRALARQDLH